MKKACIFDFDGVIVDTEHYHYLAWENIFAPYGAKISEEEYEPLKSTGRNATIAYYVGRFGLNFSQEEIDMIKRKKGEEYGRLTRDLSEKDFVPGVKDFLQSLKEANIPCAVGSSGMFCGKLVERFSLGRYFDFIVDGTSGLPAKPAPDIFLKCAELLKVAPEECYVFEDSLVGMQAAKSAGMDTVYLGKSQVKSTFRWENFKGRSPCDLFGAKGEEE